MIAHSCSYDETHVEHSDKVALDDSLCIQMDRLTPSIWIGPGESLMNLKALPTGSEPRIGQLLGAVFWFSGM